MSYVGDMALGQTFDVKFTTRQISGAPSTLASSPVISAYVGNSNTQITAGITLSVDFDSVTGLNNVRVVATGGNGYATASDYQLVITTGTVNSVSVVGEVIAEFSIENRQSNVKFWNGTAVATPATAGIPDVNVKNIDNDAASASGTVTFPNATLASTTNITAGTIATVTNLTNAPTNGDFTATMKAATLARVTLVDTITTYTGNTVQTGDSFARIGVAGAGLTNIDLPNQTFDLIGNITGNLSGSVGSVSGAVGSVTGAVGSVTGNVGGNVTGSVGSVVGAVGSVTGSVGSVVGLTAANLDATVSSRLASAAYTAPDNTSITGIKAKTDLLTFTVSNQVDANIQYVNDVQVKGVGTDANPWNPV